MQHNFLEAFDRQSHKNYKLLYLVVMLISNYQWNAASEKVANKCKPLL